MDLSQMSLDDLTALHRAKRRQMQVIRAELDQIESAIHPLQTRAAAVKKLARAGLTKAELESITKR